MYPVPTSLSPSRVEAFVSCPLAFRFASIQKLPEPPSPHTTKGSLVHRALELLFMQPAAQRTQDAARVALDQAIAEYRVDPEFTLLGLTEAQAEVFFTDAWSLVEGYFALEDPAAIHEIGLELRLEAPIDGFSLRGVIDRLELDADGNFVVTDYKTGRAPSERYQQNSLSGVHFYSFLCESVLGQRPSAIRLMYLRSGEVITAKPSAQSVKAITGRAKAVMKAVEQACNAEDFRPKEGALCKSCAFQPWCPAFGGDPALAAAEAPVRFGMPARA